ncbi:hypothetical protein [Streptosporangium canum]|uniref:hypothetical protein n=1 Tax=Streptosporangium canum TaxID=324952 RepID=UPI00379AD9C9
MAGSVGAVTADGEVSRWIRGYGVGLIPADPIPPPPPFSKKFHDLGLVKVCLFCDVQIIKINTVFGYLWVNSRTSGQCEGPKGLHFP